jgi:hypothetical protein
MGVVQPDIGRLEGTLSTISWSSVPFRLFGPDTDTNEADM